MACTRVVTVQAIQVLLALAVAVVAGVPVVAGWLVQVTPDSVHEDDHDAPDHVVVGDDRRVLGRIGVALGLDIRSATDLGRPLVPSVLTVRVIWFIRRA